MREGAEKENSQKRYFSFSRLLNWVSTDVSAFFIPK